MSRVAVVGVTGAGKTTMAETLAQRLGVMHVELDSLHWDPGWQQAPREVFRRRVAEALSGPSWVADGNYSKTRDLVWGRADTLVWLDYSRRLALGRLITRTFRRIMRREQLWNGNRETLRGTLLSRDSLLLYLFQSHGRLRRSYPQALQDPRYAHLKVVRLRSPREADCWLTGLD